MRVIFLYKKLSQNNITIDDEKNFYSISSFENVSLIVFILYLSYLDWAARRTQELLNRY